MVEDISIPAAFAAGLLSFISPCILPMVPVYLGIMGGAQIYRSDVKGMQWPLFLHSLSFVVGFTIVFTGLGMLAGLTGLAINPVLLNRIAGGLLIFFGLFILAAQKIRWLNYEKRLTQSSGHKTGYFRSFIIGAAFTLGWIPCVGPILAGILALAAVHATVWEGGYMLAIYSLGLGLPFLIIGAAFGYMLPLVKRISRYSNIIQIVSGLLLIGIGVVILTNKVGIISGLGT